MLALQKGFFIAKCKHHENKDLINRQIKFMAIYYLGKIALGMSLRASVDISGKVK